MISVDSSIDKMIADPEEKRYGIIWILLMNPIHKFYLEYITFRIEENLPLAGSTASFTNMDLDDESLHSFLLSKTSSRDNCGDAELSRSLVATDVVLTFRCSFGDC